MTYDKGCLCADLNIDGYDDSWCYDTLDKAIAAKGAWDSEVQKEPDGWMRHINTPRRRPGGMLQRSSSFAEANTRYHTA
jgi:hypothetical protein